MDMAIAAPARLGQSDVQQTLAVLTWLRQRGPKMTLRQCDNFGRGRAYDSPKSTLSVVWCCEIDGLAHEWPEPLRTVVEMCQRSP